MCPLASYISETDDGISILFGIRILHKKPPSRELYFSFQLSDNQYVTWTAIENQILLIFVTLLLSSIYFTKHTVLSDDSE